MGDSAVTGLEVRWHEKKKLFFHRDSETYIDIFRPYPEIAHLAITIIREGRKIGSCTVWPSDRRKRGVPTLLFIGLDERFNFPSDHPEYQANRWNGFRYLPPSFFNIGDIIGISFDRVSAYRVFSRNEYRRRFIEAVFDDFMENSVFGIEGVEFLWENFLLKHEPSDAVIAAMLTISSRRNAFLLSLCGSAEIRNEDVIRGNELWDQWIATLDAWRETATSCRSRFEMFSFLGTQ